MDILFIDACVRKESRTRALSEHVISKLDGKVTHLTISDDAFLPLDDERLAWREDCCRRGDFSDKYFDYARRFAQADIIVLAAPLWDNSFPAVVKKYIETITVRGLTFRYSAAGVPEGLCRAKRLYYVTTSGGPIISQEFGYGYICSMAQMYGIGETRLIKAEGLDIYGADTEKIMRDAMSAADETVDQKQNMKYSDDFYIEDLILSIRKETTSVRYLPLAEYREELSALMRENGVTFRDEITDGILRKIADKCGESVAGLFARFIHIYDFNEKKLRDIREYEGTEGYDTLAELLRLPGVRLLRAELYFYSGVTLRSLREYIEREKRTEIVPLTKEVNCHREVAKMILHASGR